MGAIDARQRVAEWHGTPGETSEAQFWVMTPYSTAAKTKISAAMSVRTRRHRGRREALGDPPPPHCRLW